MLSFQDKKPVRVLIVDDSALVRSILSQGLSADPDIHVIGTAADPYQARDKIIELKPDVLTLDVEMPRMDGVEFLRRLMPQHPLPVLMVSSLTQKGKKITIDALEAGAVDFVAKPTSDLQRGLSAMVMELCTKVKAISSVNVQHYKQIGAQPQRQVIASTTVLEGSTDKVIAIGASTGGTKAIKNVITRFPSSCPGVVIVQHMPAGFTKMFADSLNEEASLNVKEAESGDRIFNGRCLIAPGGKQLKVIRSGGEYRISVQEGPKVSGHCPSVDVLFNSVAESVGSNAVGAILTGMGSDGAKGMLKMKESGAITMAQDEKSCVVFGMPKVAWELGGADKLVPLDHIALRIINAIGELK